MQHQSAQPLRTKRNTAATRAALVGAATALFAQEGFAGTTIDDIAQQAGVNKALISYHFGGKRGLYHSILLDHFGRLAGAVAEVAASSETADRKLDRFIDIFAGLNVSSPMFAAMLLREILGGGVNLDAAILEHLVAVFGASQGIIAQGIGEGRFREVNPVATHLSVIGLVTFFFATARFRQRMVDEGRLPSAPPDAQAFIEHTKAMIRRGISTPRARDSQ